MVHPYATMFSASNRHVATLSSRVPHHLLVLPKCTSPLVGSFFVKPSANKNSLYLGNMDNSAPLEVVVAVEYRNSHTPTTSQAPSKVQVAVYGCLDPTCESLYNLGKHCYQGPGYVANVGGGFSELTQASYVPTNIALAVGNLYGRGLRVSQPQHWTVEGVPTLVAVINAPPTHLDYFNGVPVIINANTLNGNILLFVYQPPNLFIPLPPPLSTHRRFGFVCF